MDAQVSFYLQTNESIWLNGCSGAGKSSILLCLLRLVEVSGGQICIDGQDSKPHKLPEFWTKVLIQLVTVSQLGLELLRQRIALIPQDPLLFEGKNLKMVGINAEFPLQVPYGAIWIHSLSTMTRL